MPERKTFRRGDRVKWNSEAGIVSGIIIKKVTSNVRIKGYVHHASKEHPQYLIRSDKTDHVAIHKAAALHRIAGRSGKKRTGTKRKNLRPGRGPRTA